MVDKTGPRSHSDMYVCMYRPTGALLHYTVYLILLLKFLSRVIASYNVPSYPGQWSVSRGSYSTSAPPHTLGLHTSSHLGRALPSRHLWGSGVQLSLLLGGLASQPSRARLASTTSSLRHYGPIVGVVTRAHCTVQCELSRVIMSRRTQGPVERIQRLLQSVWMKRCQLLVSASP